MRIQNQLIRLLILLINDLSICAITLFLSFWMRIGSIFDFSRLLEPLLISVLCYTSVFIFFKVNNHYIKYISYLAIKNYLIITLVYGILFAGLLFTFAFSTTPKSVAIIQLPLLLFSLLLSRFVFISLFHKKTKDSFEYLVILGSDQTALSVMNNFYHLATKVIFFDKNKSIINRIINGHKVNHIEKINYFLNKKLTGKIIISSKSFNDEEIRKIISTVIDFNFSISIAKFENNNLLLFPFNDYSILFDRKIRSFKQNNFYKNKIILVTGAGGSIGSELVHLLMKQNAKKIIAIDIVEMNLFNLKNNNYNNNIDYILGDVRDKLFLKNIFLNNKIDIVLHAAAYKHVPIIEKNPLEALKNNFYPSYLLSHLCVKYNVNNFTLVSSDKAVRPSSIMGASKRLAELTVLFFHLKKNSKVKFNIVRFGNVVDSSGSVVPIFKNQILNGGPITVTNKNMIRYFMSIKEAVNLIMQSIEISNGGEIFLLDMGKQQKILNLAIRMIKLHGYLPTFDKYNNSSQIRIIYTGIRPGEKLYEELLIDNKAINSGLDGVFISKEKFPNNKKIKILIIDALKIINNQSTNVSIKNIFNNKLIGLINSSKI